MKKMTLLALASVASLSAQSAVDYSLCQEWIKAQSLDHAVKMNDAGDMEPAFEPTTISKSGKDLNTGVYTYKSVEQIGLKAKSNKPIVQKDDMKVKIVKNASGYSVSLDVMSKSGSNASVGTDYDFELKTRNNKCYPANVKMKMDSNNHFNKVVYAVIGSVKGDSEMCRRLTDFFAATPDLKSCLESQSLSKLSAILKNADTEKEVGELEKKAKNRLAKAYEEVAKADEMLKKCDALALSPTVSDDDLWKRPEASAQTDSDATSTTKQ